MERQNNCQKTKRTNMAALAALQHVPLTSDMMVISQAPLQQCLQAIVSAITEQGKWMQETEQKLQRVTAKMSTFDEQVSKLVQLTQTISVETSALDSKVKQQVAEICAQLEKQKLDVQQLSRHHIEFRAHHNKAEMQASTIKDVEKLKVQVEHLLSSADDEKKRVTANQDKMTKLTEQLYDQSAAAKNRFAILQDVVDEQLKSIKQDVQNHTMEQIAIVITRTNEDLNKQRADMIQRLDRMVQFDVELQSIKSQVPAMRQSFHETLHQMQLHHAQGIDDMKRDIRLAFREMDSLYKVLHLDKRALNDYLESKNSKKKKKLDDSELDPLVKMLLGTPVFSHILSELKSGLSTLDINMDSNLNDYIKSNNARIDKMDLELKDKASYAFLKLQFDENDAISTVRELAQKNAALIDFVLNNYLNAEQIMDALKIKADTKEVELKADRKMMSNLFDYVNEKLNKLLGEGGEANEHLLRALATLEEDMQLLARKQDAMPTQLFIPSEKPAPTVVEKNLCLPESALSVRCLSCSRPVSQDKMSRLDSALFSSSVCNFLMFTLLEQ